MGGPGISGTIDASAWTLVSDLATGEAPSFAPAGVAVASPIGPWSALGSNGAGNGALNSYVNVVVFAGTNLYVGGGFTNAAGIAKADYVAKWNGSTWSALGSNGSGDGALAAEVNAIAISGSNVYVGGHFINAAGIAAADYVAKWNGTAWSALGSNGSGNGALNAYVLAVAVSGSDLYAGGRFDNAAGIPEADHIAKWNGSAWSALGSNGSGNGAIAGDIADVYALAVSGSDLFVGGNLFNVAGIPRLTGSPDGTAVPGLRWARMAPATVRSTRSSTPSRWPAPISTSAAASPMPRGSFRQTTLRSGTAAAGPPLGSNGAGNGH